MNRCIHTGRLTRDSEIKFSSDGNTKIARNSLAVDRGKDKDGNDRGADFINLVAFGKRADFFEKFATKGRKFLVESHVQTGSYKDKDGKTIYTTDFVVDNIEFADSKPEGTVAAAVQQAQDDDFMNIPDDIDEELPFN